MFRGILLDDLETRGAILGKLWLCGRPRTTIPSRCCMRNLIGERHPPRYTRIRPKQSKQDAGNAEDCSEWRILFTSHSHRLEANKTRVKGMKLC